ncbi:MAG: hypothetical protein L0Y44_05750 [Phycisphaerales bacterium]|nr:hypothetical protein [Phycisphaerales bacterium]MCI0675941.1 hypothetical protein [Phycisphaerales bacterium]
MVRQTIFILDLALSFASLVMQLQDAVEPGRALEQDQSLKAADKMPDRPPTGVVVSHAGQMLPEPTPSR